VLSVAFRLGMAWTVFSKQLPDEDQMAIRRYVLRRMQAGDTGAPVAPLLREGAGTFPEPPPNTTDEQWLKQFLQFFGLYRNPLRADEWMFNNRSATLETITDVAVAQAGLSGRALAPEWTFTRVALAAPKPIADPSRPIPRQITLQYTFVPKALHEDDKGGRSRDNPAHQFAGQYTWQIKAPGSSGMELDLSIVGQVTLFADASNRLTVDPSSLSVQNLVAGGQAAWAIPLIKDRLQLQAIIQGVAGLMREKNATGFISFTPDLTAQVAGQMQVVVTIDQKSQLQFFVQIQRDYTWARDPSKGWALGFGFQKSFDVTPKSR
jgi:hypothetical protein